MNLENILVAYDFFIFDLDGTIWKDGEALPKVHELFAELKKHDKQVFLLTNNSAASQKSVVNRCTAIGLTVHEDEIVTSSIVTSELIKHSNDLLHSSSCSSSSLSSSYSFYRSLNWPLIRRVLVLGEEALVKQLEGIGLQTVGSPGPDKDDALAVDVNFPGDGRIDAVVVGIDYNFTYARCARVMRILLNTQVPFIATNTDANLPTKGGYRLPGAGSIVAAVESACERKAIIIGKPSTITGKYIIDSIQNKRSSITTSSIQRDDDSLRKRCLMVGDNLNTDILFGINNGMATLLVFTGVTSPKDLELSPITPTYSLSSFADLFP